MVFALSCIGIGVPEAANTSWALINIQDKEESIEVDYMNNTITLDFHTDENRKKSISGWTGCNGFEGRYRIDGYYFRVSDFFVTEIGCSPEIMEKEDMYLDILLDANRYAIEGSKLLISTGDGRVLIFARQ